VFAVRRPSLLDNRQFGLRVLPVLFGDALIVGAPEWGRGLLGQLGVFGLFAGSCILINGSPITHSFDASARAGQLGALAEPIVPRLGETPQPARSTDAFL
jgi:hypothetical protein